jgi:hypothetical protein
VVDVKAALLLEISEALIGQITSLVLSIEIIYSDEEFP